MIFLQLAGIISAMKELIREIRTAKDVAFPKEGRRLALMEGPTNCNRDCSYCTVPQRWDSKKTSTLDQCRTQVNWLYDQGYRILNYFGGEPLSPHLKTKEDITFADHTLGIVRHAAEKGMRVNVTTNGDFVTEEVLDDLHNAGLDMLTLSLHTLTNAGVSHLMKGAHMAAERKIVPDVNVVFTNDRVLVIPQIAVLCAQNGILFSTSVVQEYGGGFSSVPEQSKIPTPEQQRDVFSRLLFLKRAGFIRNNTNYLEDAPEFPGNSWKCDPEQDSFVHVHSEGEGEIGVCLEVRTGFQIGDTQLDSEQWRSAKRDLVEGCHDCLYNATFGTQNPNMRGDIPTLINMFLIRSGHARLVEIRGIKAVARQKKQEGYSPHEETTGNIFTR